IFLPPPPIQRHLETSDRAIEEVVITGYGTKHKDVYGSSSVSTVSGDRIATKEPSGTIAGISISKTGKDEKVSIRGLRSI
ncbi:hypothetical protein, partial [Chryseobacterium sp. SIMBA_038]